MSKSFRLVIFDWEGTLADTIGQILHVISEEADNLGLGPLNWEEARLYVELGLNKAISKLFPKSSLAQQEHLMDSVQRGMLYRHGEVQLIPGVRECLKRLQQAGILLAVASNKGQQSLQRAIALAGLETFFTTIRSASQTAPKPCPQMLHEILVFCDIKAEEALMVGDTAMDMEMANLAGMQGIGFDYYHQQGSVLKTAGAKIILDDYAQLIEFLQLDKEELK